MRREIYESIGLDMKHGEIRQYFPQPPLTGIRAHKLGGHIHITVWVNSGNAGILIVRYDEWPEVLKRLMGPGWQSKTSLKRKDDE